MESKLVRHPFTLPAMEGSFAKLKGSQSERHGKGAGDDDIEQSKEEEGEGAMAGD